MAGPIYPCLWFESDARAAANLYCEAFGNGRITSEHPFVVHFTLEGQTFMGLNGGPKFKPNPSISFYVTCESVAEVDRAWARLEDGGSVLMPLGEYPWSARYGWVQDCFGVSWQLAQGKLQDVGQKFAPMFMFVGSQAGKAEQAIRHYTTIVQPSSVQGILKYGPQGEDREGLVKHAQFRLGEQVFMAMDSTAAHAFGFDEGVSLVVTCDSQEEIDYYWNKLTEGGQESMCGWLKDRYGVSWQIVPGVLGRLMSDPARAQRVMQAVLQMRKFDLEKLLQA